jgi:hypothetical protein
VVETKNRSAGLFSRVSHKELTKKLPMGAEFSEGDTPMKRLLLAFIALTVATAFTAPAFAGIRDAKNKADCEKAGGVWVEKDNKCGVKKQ